jgi:hypothetical protein
MDLVGRKYEYRLLKGEIKTIVEVKGDTAIFDDNGRVPLNRLDEMFELVVDNNNTQMNPAEARKLLTATEDVLDPSNFFNQRSHQDLLASLKKQAESIDTMKLPEQALTTNTAVKHIEHAKNEPAVKKYEVERDDSTGKVTTVEATAAPKSSDFLKKMKRNHDVTLNIKYIERIPKLDFIKMMDENFDQGVLEYLIEDITEKIMNSPQIIQSQIREQLTDLVYKKESKKKKKKNENIETSEE